jgi:hypothetical protein
MVGAADMFGRCGRIGRCARRGGASLLAASALLLAAVAAAQGPSEHEVKAAFLYNFTKFVEWPETKFNADNQLLICVVGNDPFADELRAAIEGKAVRGKRLTMLYLSDGDDPRRCHVLFISGESGIDPSSVLDHLHGAGVLTVGDLDGFAAQGGVINFRMEDRRVRFEINAEAAEEEGLRISSQLFKLAIRIIGDARGE